VIVVDVAYRAGGPVIPRVDNVTHVLHPTDAVDHIILGEDVSSHAGGWHPRKRIITQVETGGLIN
jgi:hypothetical protein